MVVSIIKFRREGKTMKNKSKSLLSLLLAAVLAITAFTTIPLTASASEESFQVTEHPVGATYMLGETAVPIQATFVFDPLTTQGYLNSTAPITVRWYWSEDDSNTSRANGFTESTIDYDRKITHTTTHIPATDTPGVRYYFAVVSYSELVQVEEYGNEWTPEPRETVSNTARIEVIEPGHELIVKKVDKNGNPLAGAVFTLVPYDSVTQGTQSSQGNKTYEETSASNGNATFLALDGSYILSEKTAPAGYEGSDDTYQIIITANGVYIIDPETNEWLPYEMVTFVNDEAAVIPPTSTPTSRSITVKKADEEGNPLAGAVLVLDPDTSYAQPPSVVPHEAVSASSGNATFSPGNGYYILSEKQAPSGYNATDNKYYIHVTSDGVFFINPTTKALLPYETVTFVNKEIPLLNKDDHFAFMLGYPDGTFSPEKNMTRAEAVVMFSRLLTESMNVDTNNTNDYYPDVNPLEWYANQVGYMQSLGVLEDYSRDELFRPDVPVTRAEFATLAAHFDNLTYTDTNNFSDVTDSHWAVKYVNSAAAKGWITGYPDGTFKPENNITRAEVVTLVGRMLDRNADSAYLAANADSLPRDYTDLVPTHWAYLMIMEASLGHDYIKDSEGEHWTAVYQ